jgi:hypothetical protein
MRFVLRAWDGFIDWGDVTLWRRGKYELRRIDIVIVAGGVLSGLFDFAVYRHWQHALFTVLAYVVVLTMAMLWQAAKPS